MLPNQGSANNKARPCAVTKEKQTPSAEEFMKLENKTAAAKQAADKTSIEKKHSAVPESLANLRLSGGHCARGRVRTQTGERKQRAQSRAQTLKFAAPEKRSSCDEKKSTPRKRGTKQSFSESQSAPQRLRKQIR